MKVLLTNHSLKGVGGSEKWTWTMAREFQRRGWEVEVFTFMLGETSSRLQEAGIPVVTQLSPGRESPADLMLVNHNTCLAMVQPVSGFKIHTSHGPINALEIPAAGADAYVGVTPEVRAAHARLGFDLTVITNGIDLEEFCSTLAMAGEVGIPRVMSMCKSDIARAMVAVAATNQGLPFDYIQYQRRPVWDTASLMRQADIVVGCGRTAYEALSCGKAVLVFDCRDKTRGPSADGWLTEENIEVCYQQNCATRCNDLRWDVDDLERALHEYRFTTWQRPWAEKNCNVRDKVDQYLALARSKGGIS